MLVQLTSGCAVADQMNCGGRAAADLAIEKYGGGPVGLDTIGAAISEDASTIMDVCEPYLLQLGFLARTPRGRVATPLAYEHLGLTPPPANGDKPGQPPLF